MPSQPTALIAGGGGFLGRHLTHRLQQENWDIHYLTLAGRARPADLPGITLHTASDSSVESVRHAVGAHRFDHVFLLAAAGVSPGERALDHLFALNVAWPATIVSALSDCAAHFLHAGSWMEYAAAPAGIVWTEDHPLGGVEAYGASKAAGGLWLAGVARQLGVKLARLRLFQLYGSGEAPHRLTAMLLRELREHNEVPLSPGGQIRDFLYVADAADAFHRAAQLALDGVYNICSGNPVTVAAFAQAMAQAAGASPALLEFGKLPYRPQELMWAVGSPESFHAAAGWLPRWTLSDGLAALTREAT